MSLRPRRTSRATRATVKVATDTDTDDTSDTSDTSDTGEIDPAVQWALDYTGGSGGAASGEPIKIGVASNVSFFPEIEEGAEIAADFVSEQLGGIDGAHRTDHLPRRHRRRRRHLRRPVRQR